VPGSYGVFTERMLSIADEFGDYSFSVVGLVDLEHCMPMKVFTSSSSFNSKNWFNSDAVSLISAVVGAANCHVAPFPDDRDRYRKFFSHTDSKNREIEIVCM